MTAFSFSARASGPGASSISGSVAVSADGFVFADLPALDALPVVALEPTPDFGAPLDAEALPPVEWAPVEWGDWALA